MDEILLKALDFINEEKRHSDTISHIFLIFFTGTLAFLTSVISQSFFEKIPNGFLPYQFLIILNIIIIIIYILSLLLNTSVQQSKKSAITELDVFDWKQISTIDSLETFKKLYKSTYNPKNLSIENSQLLNQILKNSQTLYSKKKLQDIISNIFIAVLLFLLIFVVYFSVYNSFFDNSKILFYGLSFILTILFLKQIPGVNKKFVWLINFVSKKRKNNNKTK